MKRILKAKWHTEPVGDTTIHTSRENLAQCQPSEQILEPVSPTQGQKPRLTETLVISMPTRDSNVDLATASKPVPTQYDCYSVMTVCMTVIFFFKRERIIMTVILEVILSARETDGRFTCEASLGF